MNDRKQGKARWWAGAVAAFACAMNAYAVDPANTPLFWASGVQPNVMLLMDDSGSMHQLTYSKAYSDYLLGYPTTANVYETVKDNDAADLYDTLWYFCTGFSGSGQSRRCSNTTSMNISFNSFSVQTPVNGDGTGHNGKYYIYAGPGGSTNRPGSPGSFLQACDVSRYAVTGSATNQGFQGPSGISGANLGVMVSNRSGSNQAGAINACVRWKEASTAVQPRLAGGTSCGIPSGAGSSGAPLTGQETPGAEKCPASIDVFTSYEVDYAAFLLTANLEAYTNSFCRDTTAAGGGRNCLLNMANSVSMTNGTQNTITENTAFPNGTTNSIANASDVRIVPNINRIEAARQAATTVYQENRDDLRIGIAMFNGQSGANILGQGAPVGSDTVPAQIRKARAEDSTPLAESYYELLRYFRGLTPDFGNTAAINGTAAYRSPIQYRCQKSNIIVMTDGEPSSDMTNGTTSACGSALPPRLSGLPGMPANANYDGVADACLTSSVGVNYQPLMDDLAQYAYERDFRDAQSVTAECYAGESPPAIGKDCTGKSWDAQDYESQTIDTYTIGFGLKNDLLVETPETAATFTVPPTAVNVGGNSITIAAHGLQTGDAVVYRRASTTDVASIGGLQDQAKYYVIRENANVIRLAASSAEASATPPVAVDLTSAGTGNNHVFTRGPGRFYLALTAAELSAQLSSAFSQINATTSSASAVAVNSTRLDSADTVYVYQASFETEYWSGDLQAFELNRQGEVSTTEPAWKASEKVTASTRGTMLTWDGTRGVTLEYANLNAGQQADLRNDPNVISWLKGTAVAGYRERPRGLIGDVIDSDPAYVGALNFGYMRVPDPCTTTDGKNYDGGTKCTGGKLYKQFVDDNKDRVGMVYFGANDGQLHGLDASVGTEQLAYVPAGVIADWDDADQDGVRDAGETVENKLYNLTRPTYSHRYFVNGSPAIGDAFDTGSDEWHTLLASGLGAGGRSVFALDVTDEQFGPGDVLWEYSHPALGYTYSKPIIARLQTGQWAVIFGNGYDSGGDRAQLFILDAFTGSRIAILDTGVGSAASENGMSSIQVQVDATRTVTAVYGGDLQGNVWKFDLSSDQVNRWDAYRLFQATDGLGNPQPITGGIRLGSNPQVAGTMVFFGTGKYFEREDAQYNGSPQVDTFYGILDDGSGEVRKTELVQQVLSNASIAGYRTASEFDVDYNKGTKGWYVDMVVEGLYEGERIVSTPVLRGGRIIFVSLVPESADRCTGGGSSWLYDLDALTGQLISEPVFDTNGDGKIDDQDERVAGVADTSGGILSEPTIVTAGEDVEYKIMGSSSSSKSIVSIMEDAVDYEAEDAELGRMSWRQLQ